MENITTGTWVRLQQITRIENGDKFHRVPKKADGQWTRIMKVTVHGNFYAYSPYGGSALSIRRCDIAQMQKKPSSCFGVCYTTYKNT